MSREITLPKWLIAVLTASMLLVLGIFISPRNQAAHPILLLPDIKALEEYRRDLSGWYHTLTALDHRLENLLTTQDQGNLFAVSRETQDVMLDIIELLQSVDRRYTPPAAVPASDMMMAVGEGYLQAAQFTLAWVAAPTTDNLDVARQALSDARIALTEMENSQWMQR